jgi:acyl carrier protein
MAIEYAERDLQVVTEILCRLLNKQAVSLDADKNLYELGLTSITVLPLLVELEGSFKVTVPDEEFMEARSARMLARLIGQLRGNA